MEKDKNNTKKVYIIILGILIVFFLIMIYINRNNLRRSNSEDNGYEEVLIARNVIFQKTNNYWHKVTNENNIRKLVNWKKYKIYLDYNYFGEYNLVFSDGWLAFDNDRNPVEITAGDTSFFAYKSDDKYDVKKIVINENNNFEKIKKILNAFEIDIKALPVISNITKVDLNSDGNDETIYVINNTFNEIEPDNNYTAFLVQRENKIYKLFKASNKDNSNYICFPSINAVLDIDKDKEYEIIMSCTSTGIESMKTILYKYDSEKDDYEIVISD